MNLFVASFLVVCFFSKVAESVNPPIVQDTENSPPSEAFNPADRPEEIDERKLDISAYFPDYVIPNPDGVLTANDRYSQCILERHNYYRTAVGLQPLKWSDHLATLAHQTSVYFSENSCYDFHRQPFNKDNWVGENLWNIEHVPAFFGEDANMCTQAYNAVDEWYKEIRYYTYPLDDQPFNKCDPNGFKSYSHFIQLMWQKGREVGCSYAYCKNDADYVIVPKLIVNCYYDTPILMGSTVFSADTAQSLNGWSENDKYGGLKTCTV